MRDGNEVVALVPGMFVEVAATPVGSVATLSMVPVTTADELMTMLLMSLPLRKVLVRRSRLPYLPKRSDKVRGSRISA